MCCFSGRERVDVSQTKIFGRLTKHGEQALIYAMSVSTPSDVAMILPVPVKARGRFRFVDLSGYPKVFLDLHRCFEATAAVQAAASRDISLRGRLEVEQVGAFEASFVPSRDDFGRLDPRFRLDDALWSKLPDYRGFGFAVFQLRATSADETAVHPMAFQWESSFTDRIFFPTVHVHDGTVRPEADFDHVLYAQPPVGLDVDGWWDPSLFRAGERIDVPRTQRLIANRTVYRQTLSGERKNVDTYCVLKPATDDGDDLFAPDDGAP